MLYSFRSVVDIESCFFEGLREKNEDLIEGWAREGCGVPSCDEERLGASACVQVAMARAQ
jgi:hypothetical protein